ncbi:unnamed protein product, partial [Rotaria sp. Silwood2]
DISPTPSSSLNNMNDGDDNNNNRPISSINLHEGWLASGNTNCNDHYGPDRVDT